MNGFFVRIKFLLPSLPRAEKEVAKALLESPEEVTRSTLAEFSIESGVSEASIIRFCKRMKFSGYTELKENLIMAIANGVEVESEGINNSDNMKTILNKVYQSNVQMLHNTLVLADNAYDEALEALLKAKSIHFFGVGDAFATCQIAFMKFIRLGIKSSAHSDAMLQLVTAGNMTEGDVAIAISYEGRSRNIVDSMKLAKQNGATTIAITKMNKSPMLKHVDISLFISVSDLTIGRERVTRRISDQFILDALHLGYVTKDERNHSEQLKKTQDAIDNNKV